MDNTVITSESPAKAKKRKMSAAGRKAIAAAAKARWAAKKSALPADVDRVDYYRQNPDGTYSHLNGNIDIGQGLPPQPVAPVPTSPAVLKLQEQVVDLVTQRHQARNLLNEAHNAYLAAQSKFQAAESELNGIEQEVSYRIGLIAQLENRPNVAMAGYGNAPVLQMPAMSGSITSEPAQQQVTRKLSQESFAVGSADELRREVRGMM